MTARPSALLVLALLPGLAPAASPATREPATPEPAAPEAVSPEPVASTAPEAVAPEPVASTAPEAEGARVAALVEATEAELARSMGMRLPDQPPPYWIGYEVLDGDVATASAQMGALDSFDHGPYRNLRAEVRVGDYTLDNGNFEMSFGERSGVVSRLLPVDPVVPSLRREIWLATDTAYKGATEQFSAKLSARRGRPGEHPPDLVPVPPLRTDPVARPAVDGDRVRATVEAVTEALAEAPGLEEGSAIARDWQGVRFVANTEGTRAWLPTGFAVVRVEAIARSEDGARLRDLRWWVARTWDRLPPVAEMQAEARQMTAWLASLRDAPVEDDYLGPVLFEGPAAVELFRQLVTPGICGTPPMEQPPDPYDPSGGDAGPPTARLGRRLLPEGWTVVDDPTAWPGEAGSYDYDFEAVPARRVELVRDGVVRDLLMSRVPRKDLAGSNGHGRSLGTNRRIGMPGVVEVRPPRARSERRLRKKALQLAREAGRDYVLVVRRLEPPPLAEDFRVAFSGEGPLPGLTRPLEAYRLYADGRTEPVRGLEFVGVDRRALRDIAAAGAVGDPVGVMQAGPGSGTFNVGPVGGLPATWIVPPVVITELELRGRGGREPRELPPPPDVATPSP